jgi:hypothetical protein
MLDFIRRMMRRADGTDPRQPSTLKAALDRYPPYRAPHVGYGAGLSESAAAENFAFFQAVREERLRVVSDLLREVAGIDARPALETPQDSGLALTVALHEWAKTAWPPLLDDRPRTMERWLHSSRDGDEIAFSMVLDLAILLGEVIRKANPDWRWSLDMSIENLGDGMASARRIVLLADPVGDHVEPFVLDIEAIVMDRFLHAHQVTQQLLNHLQIMVEEAIR